MTALTGLAALALAVSASAGSPADLQWQADVAKELGAVVGQASRLAAGGADDGAAQVRCEAAPVRYSLCDVERLARLCPGSAWDEVASRLAQFARVDPRIPLNLAKAQVGVRLDFEPAQQPLRERARLPGR